MVILTESMEKVVEEVIKLDSDNDYYIEKMKQPWFTNGDFPEAVKPSSVLEFFEKLLDTWKD